MRLSVDEAHPLRSGACLGCIDPRGDAARSGDARTGQALGGGPRIRQFDDPNVVTANTKAGADAPLAIFMPGTGGHPQNVLPLLNVVAGQGYRVIGLTYDDEPEGNLTGTRRSLTACLAQFREMRVFGSGSGGPVTNPPGEAIVPRLAALLAYLAKAHPNAGWGAHLAPDGAPKWDRIVASGLSQGAGMAAFIGEAGR